MVYQENQEKLLRSAIRKEIEKPMWAKTPFYTKEELDAINYFNGTGFYQSWQNPKEKPNIFDTRQSFLLKMHDPIVRRKFLNNFNPYHNSEKNS